MPTLLKIILIAVLTIVAIYAGTQLTMYQNLGMVSLNHILLGVLGIIWLALVYYVLRERENEEDDEDEDEEEE
jgi:membrane protein DedA with SNARE-associated domain